jgi:anti-sigma B factor antagonist
MADAPYHHILVNEVDDIAVVHFRDQRILEEVRIQELGRELLRLIEVDGRRKLVLNFANVNFLSSAAIGKLLMLDKRLKPLDGRLKFCSIRPEIFEVFAIAKLDRQFKIYPEEADALAAFDDS